MNHSAGRPGTLPSHHLVAAETRVKGAIPATHLLGTGHSPGAANDILPAPISGAGRTHCFF